MDSLWPKLDRNVPSAPVAILKEQASLLGKSTQNLVIAEIETLQVVDTTIKLKPFGLADVSNLMMSISDKSFNSSLIFQYAFYLVAPALNHYRYQLFLIGYGIDFYPVHFRLDSDVQQELGISEASDIVVQTEEQFLGILKTIFSAEKTQRVIQAIWTQSEALATNSMTEL
ncbi:MAG: hypothetical protein NT075_08230 [Chloroflexi bacterium]|nr:hypothetical protein [Chloroflexota bacterium]